MNVNDLYSPNAESGVIASLIQNPNLYYHAENLSPKHFYNTENGFIFFSISELIKKGIEKIDAYNIQMILNSKKTTENINNISIENLNELISMSSIIARDTSDEYLLLTNEVLNYAFRRETLDSLSECKRLVLNIKEDNIQTKIYNKIENILCNYQRSEPLIPINNQIDTIWNRISSKEKANDFIDFKFPTLNNFCRLSRTDCIVVSAMQKRGKSLFLMNCLVDLIRKNKKVLYIDSELDTDIFAMRLLSHICQINFADIQMWHRGNYSIADSNKIVQGLEFIKSKTPYFFHKYEPIMTQEDVLYLTKHAKNKYGVDVVILDYLKGNGEYAMDAFKNSAYLGKMVDMCKNVLAGKEKLFLLVAAQAASDQSESIADSKKIMRNCSALLHLSRKTPQEIQNDGGLLFGNMKLRCELNRIGALHSDGDYISLSLDGNKCSFTESKQPQKRTPF